jgi:DNA-binding SARP family transcriptional activator
VGQLKLSFLGSPKIEYDSKLIELDRRKAVALLCYLAVSGQVCTRDFLAALLWPNANDKHARSDLRQALFSLKRTPIGQWIDAERDVVILRRDENLWIDTVQFSDLLADEPTQDVLTTAISLYRDNFLTGFTLTDSAEFDNWQSLQTQIFQQKLVVALEQLVSLQIAAQETEKALVSVHRLLQIDVLHEPAQRQFMRLCAATGQRMAALRQYESYVELLQQELGLVPSTEMITLYEAIRNNEVIPLKEQHSLSNSFLPPLPRLVVGRDPVVQELKQRLYAIPEAVEQKSLIIQGWPGIGKTTLVAVLAHDTGLHAQYPDGVLFTSLGEHPNLFLELSTWLHVLGCGEDSKLNTLEALSHRLAAVLSGKRVLLIIDDVWNTAHAKPFLVGGQGCTALITTRLNDLAQALAGRPEHLYKLPILTEEQSFDLLCILAPQVAEQYPAELAELAHDLEGLPLALQVAGRLLNAESMLGWSVTDLLRELREGVQILDAQIPADHIAYDRETLPTVRVLLQRSTDRLDDETRKRFALLSVFAAKPATFDLEAIRAVWQVADPKPTIRTLVARGLLEPLEPGRFQMHAILVMHARSMFGA